MATFPDAEEWAAGGYVPSQHHLKAAQIVSEILETERVPIIRVRRSYKHLPSDGLFDQRDFLIGEFLLKAAGLAYEEEEHIRLAPDVRGGPTPQNLIFWKYLEHQSPPWLGAATTEDSVGWDLVPGEAREELTAMFPDPLEREAFLLALARKFDDKHLREIGAAGEAVVAATWRRQLIDRGRPDLARKVEVLAEISDQLGYDVRAPALDGTIRRVEVKTSLRHDPFFRMVLSRNEARVGLSDPGWRLVACRKDGPDFNLVGWCEATDLQAYLPTDPREGSAWMSVRIECPVSTFRSDLPIE